MISRKKKAQEKKSNIHSHSFCLKKKNVFFHPTIIHQFFSLFKKWKKRKIKHIIQEDARPFQKNKSKN